MPGRKAKLREHRSLLQQIVADTPDATLEEICEQLPVAASIQTVHVELKKLKLVYKKNSCTPPGKSGLTLPKNVRNGK